MKHVLGILLATTILPGGAVHACSFHTYLPERTVVDRLMETENVVLARPSAENPFRFEAVEALEGTLEQAELPTLVDSVTRRRLAANPNDGVLFARDGGAYGPFQRLAYVDGQYRAMLETVMARKQAWITGDDLARYRYFASLLEGGNPALRDLALRELDRAPYDIFRQIDMAPAAGPILRDLWQVDQIPFVPIRILLLGRSPDPEARAAVLTGLERARRGSARYLGPFAVAAVELDGIAGVDRVAEAFLAGGDDPTALETAIEALAIHAGAGDAALRAHILDTLSEFVTERPEHADAVARQFLVRYDFAMAEPLEQLLKSGRIRSAKALIPVSSYVTTANSAVSSDDFQ